MGDKSESESYEVRRKATGEVVGTWIGPLDPTLPAERPQFEWVPIPTPARATASAPVRTWQRYIHEWAESKGWWDEERNFGEMLALVHSEVSEALEAWRSGKDEVEWFEPVDGAEVKPEGVAVELADVVIRVLDIAEYLGVDLGEVMVRKMAYNETRPWRHGGKRG